MLYNSQLYKIYNSYICYKTVILTNIPVITVNCYITVIYVMYVICYITTAII